MLIYDKSKELTTWASIQLFGVPDYFGEHATAIGDIRDDKIICVVVYNNFLLKPDGSPLSIEMSIASIDKRWANRHTLRAYFAYPFIQLKLKRAQITSSVNAEGVNSMLKRLGCKIEGLHREAYPMGGDAYSWSMLSNECKWIK